MIKFEDMTTEQKQIYYQGQQALLLDQGEEAYRLTKPESSLEDIERQFAAFLTYNTKKVFMIRNLQEELQEND